MHQPLPPVMRQPLPPADPLHEFILKLASRCNLACDYCYVYFGPDQTWRGRPAVMSTATITAAARRIGDHARAHRMGRVLVALHGGEPLLAGPRVIEHVVTAIREAAPPGTRVDFIAQTNGVLLDRGFLDLFARHGVRVGVSLDGAREANDRHRNRANGKSSHGEVTRALRLLGSGLYRSLFAGVLCTVDLANDPVATYQSLLEFDPPVIDLLLPHANWSRPPPRPRGASDTPYAEWMIAVFDAWYDEPVTSTRIRFFEELIHLLMGGAPATESLGGGLLDFAVVETDGAIEGTDTLKTAHQNAASTGMSVHTHSFDEALRHPAIAGARLGLDALGPTCRSCPVIGTCGGGQYTHRYRDGHGFANPSVYCADLRRLIEHVATRVHRDLSYAAGSSDHSADHL
jgi:uncharacterized protein